MYTVTWKKKLETGQVIEKQLILITFYGAKVLIHTINKHKKIPGRIPGWYIFDVKVKIKQTKEYLILNHFI